MTKQLCMLCALVCAACLLAGCMPAAATGGDKAGELSAASDAALSDPAESKPEEAQPSGTTAGTKAPDAPVQTDAADTAPAAPSGNPVAVDENAVTVFSAPYVSEFVRNAFHGTSPLYARRLNTAAELTRFCGEHKALLKPEAEAALAGYDAAFFADRALIAVYIGANSGTYRFGLDRLTAEGDRLYIRVKPTYPDSTDGTHAYTADMAGWLMLIEVSSRAIGASVQAEAELTMPG